MQDEGLANKSMMFAGGMILGRNGDEVEEETGRIDDEEKDMEDE